MNPTTPTKTDAPTEPVRVMLVQGDPMLKTPDITPAQIVAVITPILAVCVAFGVDLSDAQQQAIIGLAGVISTVLTLGDAVIRHGRATGSMRKDG